MCHDHGSRPPAPPRTGTVRDRAMLTLTGDGAQFSASYAAPEGEVRVGVVVLPDVRGLHPYYVALAERFAETGAAAVAIDWFGRTAGVCGSSGTRGPDFDCYAHIPQTTPQGIDADINAAIGYLRQHTSADLPVVTVGFCFGGGHSWRQAGGDLDLAGCVGFYGNPEVAAPTVERAHLPTVMLIPGADSVAPVSEQLELADRMRAAGAEVDATVYEGAPHCFFDRFYGKWAEACHDAWLHVLALTDRVAAG